MAQPTTVLQYKVEPLRHNSGEKEADAVRRMVNEQASQGCQLVEACGDEIRHPTLIFVSDEEASTAEYLVETVPHVKGESEVDDLRKTLIDRHDEGWIVLTVLDSPLSPPVAIYRKSGKSVALARLVVLPINILNNTVETIENEIVQQQLRYKAKLRTVMHNGLAPVLILLSDQSSAAVEYKVEKAKGGFFTSEVKKLSELITIRAKEGWRVCGAFEDDTFMPCVVFDRDV